MRFNWKDSGKASVGLIAEEVAQVLPELVVVEETGEASGVNYSKLVAVLIETAKVQETEIAAQRETITGQQGTIKGLQEEVSLLKAQMAEIEARLARE